MRIVDGYTNQVLGETPTNLSFGGEGTPENAQSFWDKLGGTVAQTATQVTQGKTDVLPAALSVAGYGLAPKIPGVRGAFGAAGWQTGERIKKVLSGEMPELYSKEYFQTLLPSGEEIGGMAKGAAADLLLSGAGKVLRPQKTLGAVKETLVGKAKEAGVKPEVARITKVGDEFVQKIDPTQAPRWNKVRTSIEFGKDPQTFTKQLSDWGSKAYTESQEIKDRAAARFYDALYQEGKSILKEKMKDVAFVRSLESYLYKAGNLTKKLLPWGVGAFAFKEGLKVLKQSGGGGQGFTPVY